MIKLPQKTNEERNINNSKSDNNGNKNENECPNLSYLGQTPLMKGGKRACVVLSPDENDAKPENNKVNENVPNL